MWDPLGTHLVISKIPCAGVRSPIPETGNCLMSRHAQHCQPMQHVLSIGDGFLALIHMQNYRQHTPTQELAG